MSFSDSNSSLDDDDNFTETNVLLGYASKEASDDTISYLGGCPQWIDPATPPPTKFVKCHVCHDLMVLLLQLNGDLPEVFPGHERRIYVWACRRKACKHKSGSVRALRGLRVAEEKASQREIDSTVRSAMPVHPAINLGEALFGSTLSSSTGPNPFTCGDHLMNSPAATVNPFSTDRVAPPAQVLIPKTPASNSISSLTKTFAKTLSLDAPSPLPSVDPPVPEPWPQNAEFPQPYPQYYLAEADYEVLEKHEEIPMPLPVIDVEESEKSGGGRVDKVVFESSIDKTFQKFADRLAQNPEQVLRYEFKGEPLLYSKTDAVGKLLSATCPAIPRCTSCGAERVFELQLTPHTIMELERGEFSLDGMDWGTIIIGVCTSDCQARDVPCGSVGYVEEWAGVQWEELR